MSKQCHTRRDAPTHEFQHRTEDRHVWARGKVFSGEASTGSRLEGGTPIGVLFGRNGGWKIPLVKVAGGKVFRRWFGFCEAL